MSKQTVTHYKPRGGVCDFKAFAEHLRGLIDWGEHIDVLIYNDCDMSLYGAIIVTSKTEI